MKDNPPQDRRIGHDAMSLLEQLEQVIADGNRIPLSSRIMIDGDEAMSLIEGIRSRFPGELRESRWLLMERDRIISEAREQAAKLIADAREQAVSLAEDTVIARQAQAQAQEITDKAKAVAREIRYGALEYADGILNQVQKVLEQALNDVAAGRGDLKLPVSGGSETPSSM